MGSGFKDFAAGDILTAADVDGYLMRQTVMTFADASARDSALSGVLDEGMMAYLEDTNATTYYDGSAWQDIRGLGGGSAVEVPGTFAAGDVVQAAEMNALPGGVIEYATNATNDTMTGSEAVTITASSFTAVAGRLYRLTYFEPAAQAPAGAGAYFFLVIKANGTQLTRGQVQESGATQVANSCTVSCVTTLTAGATTITANAQTSGGTTNLFRGATLPAYLLVEDIGPS